MNLEGPRLNIASRLNQAMKGERGGGRGRVKRRVKKTRRDLGTEPARRQETKRT